MPSSRKIERATYESVPFRVLATDQHPDHDTISDFRKRHLKGLGAVFKQVLRMCQRAGLVKLGHVALDGTKVKANASKHKAMSYERMLKSEKDLEAEIANLLKRAQKADEAEDVQYGKAVRGEELPEELQFKSRRLEKIREAKESLEREAREKAEAEARERAERDDGGKKGGRTGGKRPEEAKPKPKAQRNFTDPQSRIMLDKSSNSFQQCYNAQAAVDEQAQVIVAAEVTQDANDKHQLIPMVALIEENTGGLMPKRLSADNGYFTAEHIEAVEEKIDLYVATGRIKKGQAEPTVRGRAPADLSTKQRMARKLRTKKGREVYAKRKDVVEPVFGQTKHVRGLRQFSLRGLEAVRDEWRLMCSTHNLLKLFRSGWLPC
jgi:hypothetical protein